MFPFCIYNIQQYNLSINKKELTLMCCDDKIEYPMPNDEIQCYYY